MYCGRRSWRSRTRLRRHKARWDTRGTLARMQCVGASKTPPETDSERAREHRLELLVRVHDVAPPEAEVSIVQLSKSVGPTPHQAHAGESETASGPAAC